MQITKCNKCGEVKKKESAFAEKWVSGSLNCGYMNGGYISFDLCEKCSGELAKYVKNYLGIKKK